MDGFNELKTKCFAFVYFHSLRASAEKFMKYFIVGGES